MDKEEKEELQELINLLYNNHLSQYGKRKLEKYIQKQEKIIDKMAEEINFMTNMGEWIDKKIDKLDYIEEVKEYFKKEVDKDVKD